MCSASNTSTSMVPFGLKLNSQSPYFSLGSQQLSLELQRAQLQDYTHRLQLGIRHTYPNQVAGLNPLPYHNHLVNPYLHPYFYKDPRARFIHEEPKPNHSYIGLIAMAILGSRDNKLVLSDIYQWILDNYSYFRTRGPGWRNSIRHNLSLNDCFIKSGRSANGKGHYWAIHPANFDDFQKGDFRRRRAQRRVRKHMGLSVPDDDDDDSPVPSPTHLPPAIAWEPEGLSAMHSPNKSNEALDKQDAFDSDITVVGGTEPIPNGMPSPISKPDIAHAVPVVRRAKRLFDVESLLAPDPDSESRQTKHIKLEDNVPVGQHDISNGSDAELEDNTDNKGEHDKDISDSSSKDGDSVSRHSGASEITEEKDGDYESHLSTLHQKPYGMFQRGLPNLPHFVTGLHSTRKGNEAHQRLSAFRNTGHYVWSSFPAGYLSNYHQFVALNAAGHHTGLPVSTGVNAGSAQRWQNTMASLIAQNQNKEESKTIDVVDD